MSSPARNWRCDGPDFCFISNSLRNIRANSTRAYLPIALAQRALHLLNAEAFDDIADAHVLVVLERHAAFLADLPFAHVVLEALERRERAFVHDDIVADEPDFGAALHRAFGDLAPGNLADLGDVEDFQNAGIAEEGLAQFRRKLAGHRLADVIN